jgi:hypothetical protein
MISRGSVLECSTASGASLVSSVCDSPPLSSRTKETLLVKSLWRDVICAQALLALRGMIALILLAAATSVSAEPSWQEELAKMPLTEKPVELNGHNCAPILFSAFQRSPVVQALILMPGATDELYFFRRAHARITNAAPTLLDAVSALTNQTFIQATFRAPLLLLHTVEDPLEPSITVEDERTANRIRKKHFEKHAIFYDRDWDFVEPILAFDLNTRLLPALRSHDSHHFFRNSLVEYDLNGWDALKALALAGKTKVVIQRRRILFQGDNRYRELPPNLGDFRIDNSANRNGSMP